MQAKPLHEAARVIKPTGRGHIGHWQGGLPQQPPRLGDPHVLEELLGRLAHLPPEEPHEMARRQAALAGEVRHAQAAGVVADHAGDGRQHAGRLVAGYRLMRTVRADQPDERPTMTADRPFAGVDQPRASRPRHDEMHSALGYRPPAPHLKPGVIHGGRSKVIDTFRSVKLVLPNGWRERRR